MKIRPLNYRHLAKTLSQGFGIALLFSFFIYAEHYNLSFKLLNTLTALTAFYFLLSAPRAQLFATGGFIGLLWFYWIGYSFEYYNVGWMAPFITLFFILLYSLFFGLVSLSKQPLIRAVILFLLSYIEPMDWNWLQMELPFIDSYLGVEKWQYALILLSLALIHYLGQQQHFKRYRFTPLLILLFAIPYQTQALQESSLKIKLYAPTLLQENKWKRENRKAIIEDNFTFIKEAIKEGYDLVVLPESAFPLYLNRDHQLRSQLKYYSRRIDIITGALYTENKNHFNVSYHFSNTKMTMAKKLVLVPFGEYIPLPKFMQDIINDLFFDGTADFQTATAPTDFIVKGVSFRSAICYEATCEEIYEGNPKYLIAISNNAWFHPSIEPTLQKLLMQFYTKKHGSIIYHSANMGGAGVVSGRTLQE